MALQAYEHGIKKGQMPEPYWFFWGTAAFGVAGIVAMGNDRLGTVLAWGFLIGAFVYQVNQGQKQEKNATQNGNPSAQQITAGRAYNPFQNRSTGNQAIQ
jgi:hypothetical protein